MPGHYSLMRGVRPELDLQPSAAMRLVAEASAASVASAERVAAVASAERGVGVGGAGGVGGVRLSSRIARAGSGPAVSGGALSSDEMRAKEILYESWAAWSVPQPLAVSR